MSSPADFLRSLPYFSALTDEGIEQVGKALQERSFVKGELLFLEGEPSPGLYIVKSGRVRIFKTSPEGKEQVLFIAQPGESFNDVPVFDGGPNPASASALEPTTIYIVPREALLKLIGNCPAALSIIRLLASRLRHLTRLVEDLSFRRVVSRVSKILLEHAAAEGNLTPAQRLTQQEMAAMAGTARDVVGRALKSLEKAGAIRIEGHRIILVNPKTLQEMI